MSFCGETSGIVTKHGLFSQDIDSTEANIREFKISRQQPCLKSDFAIFETLARLSQLGHYVLCLLGDSNSPRDEFLRKISKFKKSRRDSLLYVHVVDKM